MLCNYLQNVAAITYIFVLQLSTFLFYNKHAYALVHVKDQTPELCLVAVRQNSDALKFVRNKTPEIRLAAKR